jgi:hypothetical protein
VELDFDLEATGFEVGEIVARLSATRIEAAAFATAPESYSL